MDDEKYFKLIENNDVRNRYFYSIDPATAPRKIKFQWKIKFESKMSSKDASGIYVHRSKQAVKPGNIFTDKRLLPFIVKYHSNGNALFSAKHITQILFKSVWLKKISYLFLVLTIH